VQQLKLSGRRALKFGAYRAVYQHPDDDDLLVKVIRPEFIRRQRERTTWYNSWRRHGHFKSFMRELENYLVLQQRSNEPLPFVQRFAGVVDTDRGMGMVVGKVRAADGSLAPTLAKVVKQQGFTPGLRAQVEQLLREVSDHHVVICDVSPTNMVLAGDHAHGNRLVVIDGFGERLFVPVHIHSKKANTWNLTRRFRRMIADLETLDRRRAQAATNQARAPAE
jgi:hypothetical protein